MAEVTSLWTTFTDWLRANAPSTFATLRPGADDATLQALSERLGLDLPELRETIAMVHGEPPRLLRVNPPDMPPRPELLRGNMQTTVRDGVLMWGIPE